MNILATLFIAYFSWKWWNSIIEIYYDFNKIFVLYFETTKMLIFWVCFRLYYLNLSGKNGFWDTNHWSDFCYHHWELICRNKWHPGISHHTGLRVFYCWWRTLLVTTSKFGLLTIRKHNASRKHLFLYPQGGMSGPRKPKKNKHQH